MIADAQMAEFVHKHVLECRRRGEGKGEVESYTIARIEAAPEALERAYADNRRRNAEARTIQGKPARHVLAQLRIETGLEQAACRFKRASMRQRQGKLQAIADQLDTRIGARATE